ncbi:hypothetical protein BRD05_05325 [Halobacteriales archaeon QS_9_70_65]|nr:MAG: hypothetical protein BRD05_05325 [Halobacteriales archaeon QS_9_70_65]
MQFRRRAALSGRAAVSLAVLAVFGILLTGVFVAAAAVLAVVAAPVVLPTAAAVTLLPHASAVLPVSAVVACVLSWLGLVLIVRYTDAITRALGIEYLWWPQSPASAATTAVSLALLYEGVVELVRAEVESLRAASTEPGDPAPAWLRRRVVRLCAVADVPPPEVIFLPSAAPVAFTVGTAAARSVVVSQGVVDALDDDELDAGLAHEVSHLANRDVTLMSAALAPVFVGREVFESEADGVAGRLARSAGRALLALGEFGAGTFSRGREFAADRGAAHVTGEPAALASALETLSADRARPAADLRDGDPAQALNVVPRATDRGGSFDSHPETAARIARLRELERAQEVS